MGFAIYYRSTRPVSRGQADAIRSAAERLSEGRTWLSCEPVCFFPDTTDGTLFGGSKPNFQSNPEDVAAAAREGLPDGTVRDLLDVLCRLSKAHGVDWEFHHDYDPEPIGFVRNGVADANLAQQVEGFADVGDILNDFAPEFDTRAGEFPRRSSGMPRQAPDSGDEGDSDEDPDILPFPPRNK
jgi:hypothetical protein